MSPHLSSALQKFNSNKEVDYNLSLHDFICDSYVKLQPCSYGAQIQERLRRELSVDKVHASENIGDFKNKDKYFELKVSFLSSKNYSFSLTHIRPWQHINYYLICFIDCEDNFKPNFYVLDKHTINKFKLTPMNGTPVSNSGNFNIDMRTTIKKDSEQMRILQKSNKLSDTSIDSLKRFLRMM